MNAQVSAGIAGDSFVMRVFGQDVYRWFEKRGPVGWDIQFQTLEGEDAVVVGCE